MKIYEFIDDLLSLQKIHIVPTDCYKNDWIHFFIEINTNFYLTLTKWYWFSTIKMQDLLLPPTFKEKENYKGLFL